MKKAFISMALLSLLSCSPGRKITDISLKDYSCPSRGVCNVEVFQNKKLIVQPGQYTALKYQLTDSNESSVIKYTLKRGDETKAPDSEYREEIIFEIDSKLRTWDLKDAELQSAKMLFGRFCFCPDSTGYFPITSGTLSLNVSDSTSIVKLFIELHEIPQITRNVEMILK